VRTLLTLVVIAVVACNAPPFAESSGGLQVLSKGGPPVKLQINGRDVIDVPCNGGERLLPGEKGVPRLPWDVKVISQSDGRTLLDERIAELPRWLLVQRDSAGVSSSPISGPFVPCASSGTLEVPGSCSKQTAARLVDDFFARWNNRDAVGTAALFSASLSFNDNIGNERTTLSERSALQRYLADRFALGDRFSNVVAQIPENPAPARANPTVSFMRNVGATTYRGNAKLVCVDDLLRDLVMSVE
jgi:hypothetical protein